MQTDKNPQLLIIDDEPNIQSLVEAVFFEDNYDLFFASDGEGALKKLDNISPDAILLDIFMPGLNGFEVCRRIKEKEQWRNIPVMIITGVETPDNLIRGFDAGADEFLYKPFRPEELQSRIKAMLRIKTQYDELKENLRLKELLFNMIVHDMNNPLTCISVYSDLLKDFVKDAEGIHILEKLLGSTLSLKCFIHDLLILYKSSLGKLMVDKKSSDIKEFIISMGEKYRPIAKRHSIEIIIEVPEESRQFSIDLKLFQRLFDNLLSNALKFSPDCSTVGISLKYIDEVTGKEFSISVADKGPGIPENYYDHIFNIFEIVEIKENNIPQIGLGLAFCRMIAEAHGGCIYVTSNKPTGSIFVVEI